MLTKKRRLISCLLGFCLCLNLLFPAIALAEPEPEPIELGFDLNHPDDSFLGGDNYQGGIDEVRIYPKAIVIPPETEPAPINLTFDINNPDAEIAFLGGDNYQGDIDEVRIYPQAIAIPTEPEPEPVSGETGTVAFLGGDNYTGTIDDTTIYEAAVAPSSHAPVITIQGLSAGQEISAAENTLNFGLLIEDADVDFDHELETEIYIGVLDTYQKVTTFIINDRLNNQGKFTAQNGTEYDITINKSAYVPKYATEFTIKVIATDQLGVEGEKKITLVQSANILAQWLLDSVRDGIAVDSGGLGNNGVIQGAALTTGIFGNAILLDGTDDYVEAPLTPSLTITTSSFSIEAWLKTTDAPTVDKGVAGNYQTTTNPYWMLRQCGDAAEDRGKFAFTIRDVKDTAVNITSNKLLNDGEWHHLVGVRDAKNKKAAFYVDGALVQEVAADLGDVNSEQNICLGAHLDRYFQGCLDEVTLYGCALTAAEIQRNYQRAAFLEQLKMTNQLNDEATALCTFGVHINKLEFVLKRDVNKLALELDLPSSIKIKEILKVSKDGVLIPNPAVTVTESGDLKFTQLLAAGHYQVELLLNIDEHLTIKAKNFYDEKESKINCDKEIFWFKFMDSDALPNVL